MNVQNNTQYYSQISKKNKHIYMSVQTFTPIHNDIRYDIKLLYHKQNSLVIYEMIIRDLAFGKEQMLIFRFSQIKRFHQSLIKSLKSNKQKIPQLPKTNSFGFWNRTNTNPKKIEDRKRELQYYFTKLFNDPILRGLRQVKTLLRHCVKQRRRTRSMNFIDQPEIIQIQIKNSKVHSLPKAVLNSFPRSANQEIFSQS